ncbi:hypothetical protein KDD17_06105 [Sulfitobacter albidus]|uniref:Sulfotransferase family protein n=1 Tax=Sulfitobacter albidus TaxID=2829501 RepID=A0A975JG29_9RHOB|nr:hypothetical protein [Sulfitobacter albidus]QUJ77546.1 hypothetical protein KDD17_06105 [Sulfitobacter albidus]
MRRCGDERSFPLYVHLGAHRTGTSSFQMMLAANAGTLRGAGYDLGYPGRDDIPGGTLRLRLPSPRNVAETDSRFIPACRDAFAQLRTGAPAGLILSEENIPGRMLHFRKGQFYPAAPYRLRTLLQAGGPVTRAVLVVRAYTDLYISAWRKRAEDNASPPFQEAAGKLLRMDGGWPRLAQEVIDTLAPQAFVVLEYGARGRSVDLLHRLVPETAQLPLEEPARVMNLSATDAALEALQRLYAEGRELPRAEWQRIVTAHRADTTPRGLSKFTARQHRILSAHYREDLDRLGAMPGLTLIRAPQP